MERYDLEFWKALAIERRMRNKALKKREKELLISRDSWKSKFMLEKESRNKYENELSLIKKKLSRIL
jgi:hypothetical protein